jgi:hypothetical protein
MLNISRKVNNFQWKLVKIGQFYQLCFIGKIFFSVFFIDAIFTEFTHFSVLQLGFYNLLL